MTEQTETQSTPLEDQGSDPTPPSSNPFEDQLKEIKNEDGEQKYKSTEDALKALAHSQDYIKTLQAENKQKEELIAQQLAEIEARKSVEEVVKGLKGQAEPQQTAPQTVDNTQFDPSMVEQLVLEKMESMAQAQKQEQNLEQVINHLQQAYGDKARDVLAQKARELDTSIEELKSLSSRNPTMALRLLGAGNESSQSTPPLDKQVTDRGQPQDNPMPKFERSLMQGATSDELADAWKQVRDFTYKSHGVTE